MVLCYVFLSGACLANNKDIDTRSSTKSLQTTQDNSWKVGDRIIENSICFPYKNNAEFCYTIYLRTSQNGSVLIQDYYDSGEKQSDPYNVTSLDVIKYSIRDRMSISGLVEGKQAFYFRNGQLELTSGYNNGKRDGLWTWWYEDGIKKWYVIT